MSKQKNKSLFKLELEKSFKKSQEEKLSEEQKKELRLAKLEQIFNELGNKKNRYLFYCPDMPFAVTLVKAIYEHAYCLQQLGFNATVLHEIKGFKPNWFMEPWRKEVKVDYVNIESQKKKNRPFYNFQPTDTIIIPEGFWTVMNNFIDVKSVQKVVLALGYGGLATVEPGFNWAILGFNQVICSSDRIKEDYQKLWPDLTYYVANYSIDTELFSPAVATEVYPAIALSTRSREDAQSIINIFYGRYPFLDMFQFKVLKKLDTNSYADTLKHCCCLVFVDEKAGHPAPPLEALACNVPTIAVYGRGMEHLAQQEGIIWITASDNYEVAEAMAQLCFDWLSNQSVEIKDKTILQSYSKESVKKKILDVYSVLQESRVRMFSAVKTAIEEGRIKGDLLDGIQFEPTTQEVEVSESEPSEAKIVKMEIVK